MPGYPKDDIISAAMKTVLCNTKDFMFVKDKNLVYVDASEAFAVDCAGRSSVEDVIGKTDYEIFEDQTIANKYRIDDVKLLETEEAVMEYREEYPGKEGRKRYCLTTKCLIRDSYGNPTGIFGRCHDITEQVELEIINENDINRKIVDALNGVFYASYFGNLKSDSFVILRGKEYARKMLSDCYGIEKGFESFIDTLVNPLDADKMREFCDVSTIAERLKNKSHIDCEYRGTLVEGWCQTSFIPVDYDENGDLLHFLFVISSVDQNKAKEIEEGISNKRSLKAIFDKVPGGIVMYEWNGKQLKTMNISRYYKEQYGYSMENNGGPDYQRIHPDDVKAYQEAIRKALTETHSLEYVYRVWNRERDCYVWTQINAVSELQPDGTSLVYAMYSDVTRQKDAELQLEKKSASLVAALKASKQLCYEYDPKLHVQECLTDDEVFHLPRRIENYPESILELVHPEDRDIFIRTIHLIDEGKAEASCNIRLKIDEKYVWYSYQLHSFYDFEKERIIVLMSIMDNSEHVSMLKDYEERMRALLSVADASLILGTMNVTENTYSVVYARDEILNIVNQAKTFEDIFKSTVHYVVGTREQENYRKLFSRENLLSLAEQGHMSVQMDHMYYVGENHLEWVRTCVDMLKNPNTGDIAGVCYAKSIQEETIKDILLEKILQSDYPMAAIVYAQSGEYYLFDTREGKYCTQGENYWDRAQSALPGMASEEETEKLKNFLTKDKVLNQLKEKNEYVYTFYSDLTGEECRMEIRYTYVDRAHGLIMVSVRNITDNTLLEQYKYDSEHDALTGLLNRRSLFKKCRQLLEEHPNEQFIMLHGDIKNFHLYNTFFGEEAGDQLLCDIAERFRIMSEDYEYWAYGRIEADVFCAFFPSNGELFKKHANYLLNEIPKTHNDFLVEPHIGIYVVQDPTMPIEAMFNRATIAAKSDVKNVLGSISKYDTEMEQTLLDNQQITREMKTAIEEEQFKVYLQPKYSLRTQEIVGSEALVRWIHPERGLISPGRFIPIFERNGFIVELDHYMWEQVCKILCSWRENKKPMFPVSVNVSRVSMYSQGTVAFLKDLVTKYDIEPKYMELELTETAYMDDPEEIKIQLKELQDFGFHILMDDFGSGYSSLNTLRELPVDVLKLDMKFLTESCKDLRGSVVLSSVVRMSKLLRLPIVAEGVETAEQAAYLRSLGCEYVQGYFFARPMPVIDYEQLLPIAAKTFIEEKSPDMEKIYEHITMPTNSVAAVSPIPMGFLEYYEDKFSFLRLNQSFFEEFSLNKNLNPVSQVFRDHLDNRNYAILLNAIRKCAKEQGAVTFRVYWNTENGERREYSSKVLYQGNVGNHANMVVAFMNTTEFDLKE